jgi:hypothetical protein
MPKLLCALMLLAGAPLGPAVAQTVEGNVVNSVTGNGIAGVKVELFWSGDLAYSTTTDAQGHFLFDHVQDGAYTAGYSSPDYEFEDMFREPGGPRTIRVTAGGNPVKLLAHMMPMGKLSGRVVDGRGEAVPKAQVEISAPWMQMAIPADAQGKFELHQFLFPGGYTLSAAPPPGLKPPDPEPAPEAHAEPDSGRVQAWARTWYPGATVPEAASKIVLPPGGEVSDIELKLRAVPAHAVRGVLLHPDGKPAPKIEITLDGSPQDLRAESKPDGAFEFPAVVDGEFYLAADMEVPSGPHGAKLRAGQWLEIAGHEREGLKLQLNAPFTVRGKVVMEAPQGMAAPRFTRFVTLAPVDRRPGFRLPNPPPHNSPDADGNFSLENVYPGVYQIRALPPPAYYLDAVRFGDSEMASPEVELSSGAAPITLVFKTNGGTVRGTVEQCASGGVVLVPQDPAMRWPDLIREARCDGAPSGPGRYEITAVRPGEYYVLALAGDGSTPFWTPKWDDGLLSQAGKVTVRAGEASSADLRAIAQPPY